MTSHRGAEITISVAAARSTITGPNSIPTPEISANHELDDITFKVMVTKFVRCYKSIGHETQRLHKLKASGVQSLNPRGGVVSLA